MAEKALSGIKVLEYCEMVTGPYCTRQMADFGADVIKVEDPAEGDPARRRGPFPGDVPHPERSGLFLYVNTNKRGITLNLATQKGRQIFRDLAAQVDVVVEDRTPGAMQEMGLDYPGLKSRNERLIMASITPFGQTGPHSRWKAYHLNTYHGGGEGFFTPAATDDMSRPPLQAGGFLGDYQAAVMATVGILSALMGAKTLGIGQYIDVSKQECLSFLNAAAISAFANQGQVGTRAQRRFAVAGWLPCKDGYVDMTLHHNEMEWQGLVEWMGNPEWAKAPEFKNRASRAQNRDLVNSRIIEFLKDWTMEDAYHAGQKHKIPISAYYRAEDIVESEQTKARQFIVKVAHPEAGVVRMPGVPYQFSEMPWRVERPSPRLGEHNDEVYCGMLGYTKEQLVRLRQANII